MESTNVSYEKNGAVIAFIFDSGRIENFFYGNVVFKNIFKGKEVFSNPRKIIVSVGDIIDRNVYDDITPYLIRDELCTIKKNEERYKNNLFVFLLEDIDASIAQSIDERMKKEFDAYIGMTSVDINSKDMRKQFWKLLIRSFSVEYDLITWFGLSEEGAFDYYDSALELGFRVNYDNFPSEYAENLDNLFSTRQSTLIHSMAQLQFVEGKSDSDRGIIEMNFSLVREVEIAGVQIWKAIEDIDRVTISKEGTWCERMATDYIFTSFYQASQGIERLMKVIIELYAYDISDKKEREKINNLLYGHNHLAMYEFIYGKCHLQIYSNCTKLLSALMNFYNKARYSRYSYSNTNTLELKILRDFGSDVSSENFDDSVKHRYGKALGQVSHALYKCIEELSHKIRIFVYELNYESTASLSLNSCYSDDLYDLLKRIQQSKKELVWYLIKEGSKLPAVEFLDNLSALPFEQCDIFDFLSELITNKSSCITLYDFVSDSYDELVEENKFEWKNRIEEIDMILSNKTCADEFDDGDDDTI